MSMPPVARKYHLAIPEVKARYTLRTALCADGDRHEHGTRCGCISRRDATTGSRAETGGMRPQQRPEGLIPKGDEIVELDLVIGALQTFAVPSSRLRGVSRDPQDGRIADFSRAGIARSRRRPPEGTHGARARLWFSQNTILELVHK